MPPMVIIETWRGRSERLSSFWLAGGVTVRSFIALRVYRRCEPGRCEASLAVADPQALRPGNPGRDDDFDPSNPIDPDGSGGFKKIIPQDQSSGQILAALLPPGAKFVKAFGSLAAGSLKSGARHSPEPYVLFYASDDRDAGNAVADLIKASGFAPVSVGGVSQAIRIEVFGDLHQMGKLGRLVTAKEAAALV
jgi:hypothetical protein